MQRFLRREQAVINNLHGGAAVFPKLDTCSGPFSARDIWRIRKILHTYVCNKRRLNRHCRQADKKRRLSLHGE